MWLSGYNIVSTVDTNAPLALAKAALQKRHLSHLDEELNKGDLVSARQTIKSAIKAFTPTYGNSSPLGISQTVINNDFQTISKALDKGDLKAAQNAWKQTQTHLANAGVASLSNSPLLASEAQTLAQSNSMNALYGAAFSNSSQSNWLVYSATGRATNAMGSAVGNLFNALA